MFKLLIKIQIKLNSDKIKLKFLPHTRVRTLGCKKFLDMLDKGYGCWTWSLGLHSLLHPSWEAAAGGQQQDQRGGSPGGIHVCESVCSCEEWKRGCMGGFVIRDQETSAFVTVCVCVYITGWTVWGDSHRPVFPKKLLRDELDLHTRTHNHTLSVTPHSL